MRWVTKIVLFELWHILNFHFISMLYTQLTKENVFVCFIGINEEKKTIHDLFSTSPSLLWKWVRFRQTNGCIKFVKIMWELYKTSVSCVFSGLFLCVFFIYFLFFEQNINGNCLNCYPFHLDRNTFWLGNVLLK